MIKNSSDTWCTPKKNSNYFGAFINNSLNTATHNTVIKLGIPKLIPFEERKIDIVLENALDHYLNKFPEDTLSAMCIDKITDTSDKDYRSYFTENIFKYSNKRNSIPEIVLKKESEKMAYYYNMHEECLLFNPFKIINYEVELQQDFNNIIYKIEQPVDFGQIYTFVIYLIQGIPSKLFKFNESRLKFDLTDNRLRLVGCIHEITQKYLDYFIDFGTKMYLLQILIEHYLYRQNDDTPFTIKLFYSLVNSTIIKINENFMMIKNEWNDKTMSMIGLHNKVEDYDSIITILYNIFNLPMAVNNHIQNGYRDINHFIDSYKMFTIKSHKLLNVLFEYFNSFHIRSNNYYLIKNILVNSLKSYFVYILRLLFNNEICDIQNEYFMIKNNNIGLDPSKLPAFLLDFKNILLNNTILLNYIQKFDENLFSVCNFKMEEFERYIDEINFSQEMNSDIISNFINVKNSIFNKKLELMFSVNDAIIVNIFYLESKSLKQKSRNDEKINFHKKYPNSIRF
jgi:hypothetical protein